MNTIEWLLSESNPSIRYWTLKDLLSKPEDDAQVQESKKLLAKQDIVQKIFSFQKEEGFWGSSQSLWGYKNTSFQLLLLSKLGLTAKGNPPIEKAIDWVFQFQRENGSFASINHPNNEFCLTAIILRSLLLFDYGSDPRIQDALHFLISSEDDGWSCRWYPTNKEKVIPEKCYMGGVKVLGALAKLPPHLMTREVKELISRTVQTYLKHKIYWYRRDKTGKRTKKPSWTKFAFPHYWNSDALEVLDILTELQIRDERMQEALDLVKSKQVDGRWILERCPRKMLVTLEEKGSPSKWITLRALRVLQRAGIPLD
jgi:hypothetical protein